MAIHKLMHVNSYQTIPVWKTRVIKILFGIGFIPSLYLLIIFI